MTIKAYGARAGDLPLEAMDIVRRAPGAQDVQIEIAYCGVCHSDLHQVRAEWAGTRWPCVPGHEIVGRVTAVGAQVTAFAPGDQVGVGCFVGSCGHCQDCDDGLENYCDAAVGTYNGRSADAPGHTLGGYSQAIVVDQRFVLRIRHPESQLAAVASPPADTRPCRGWWPRSGPRRWGTCSSSGSSLSTAGCRGWSTATIRTRR